MDDTSTDAEAELTRRRGVVAVVFIKTRFLVIRRSAHVVAPGAFCFPGGGIERDETEEQALVREFQEELGTQVAPLRQIWTSVTPWHVELAWWLCRLDNVDGLMPNPAEVESLHWLTRDEMLAQEKLLVSNHDFLAALDRGEIVVE